MGTKRGKTVVLGGNMSGRSMQPLTVQARKGVDLVIEGEPGRELLLVGPGAPDVFTPQFAAERSIIAVVTGPTDHVVRTYKGPLFRVTCIPLFMFINGLGIVPSFTELLYTDPDVEGDAMDKVVEDRDNFMCVKLIQSYLEWTSVLMRKLERYRAYIALSRRMIRTALTAMNLMSGYQIELDMEKLVIQASKVSHELASDLYLLYGTTGTTLTIPEHDKLINSLRAVPSLLGQSEAKFPEDCASARDLARAALAPQLSARTHIILP